MADEPSAGNEHTGIMADVEYPGAKSADRRKKRATTARRVGGSESDSLPPNRCPSRPKKANSCSAQTESARRNRYEISVKTARVAPKEGLLIKQTEYARRVRYYDSESAARVKFKIWITINGNRSAIRRDSRLVSVK